MTPRRIGVLDSLRGLAAAGVVYYHYGPHFPEGILRTISSKAGLGVDVFFVISGFIIPYTLHLAGYRIGDYGRFILKRIVRLDPPYIASLALILVLGFLAAATPGYRGEPYRVNPVQVALHLGYVNVFFGYPWLNPVYWTLAIELQYYLLIGLVFPLIARHWLALFAAFAALAFTVNAEAFVFRYLFLFMLGITTYRHHVLLSGRREYLLTVCVLGVGLYLTLGGWVAGAGVLTAIAITFVRANPFWFLGTISYSLYLIHAPISERAFNLVGRFTDNWVVLVLSAATLTVLASCLLYYLVEKPSQKWSKLIRYRRVQNPEIEQGLSPPPVLDTQGELLPQQPKQGSVEGAV